MDLSRRRSIDRERLGARTHARGGQGRVTIVRPSCRDQSTADNARRQQITPSAGPTAGRSRFCTAPPNGFIGRRDRTALGRSRAINVCAAVTPQPRATAGAVGRGTRALRVSHTSSSNHPRSEEAATDESARKWRMLPRHDLHDSVSQALRVPNALLKCQFLSLKGWHSIDGGRASLRVEDPPRRAPPPVRAPSSPLSAP